MPAPIEIETIKINKLMLNLLKKYIQEKGIFFRNKRKAGLISTLIEIIRSTTIEVPKYLNAL